MIESLANALREYVKAQGRMLDKWADGDENVKRDLWQNLHACEEAGRKALAILDAQPVAGAIQRELEQVKRVAAGVIDPESEKLRDALERERAAHEAAQPVARCPAHGPLPKEGRCLVCGYPHQPVAVTDEMIAAGMAVGCEQASHAQHCEEVYLAMRTAAPQPAATERDAVIEECAQRADYFAEKWKSLRDANEEDYFPLHERWEASASIAESIRALKSQPGAKGEL
jgi:hypothetical protein